MDYCFFQAPDALQVETVLWPAASRFNAADGSLVNSLCAGW